MARGRCHYPISIEESVPQRVLTQGCTKSAEEPFFNRRKLGNIQPALTLGTVLSKWESNPFAVLVELALGQGCRKLGHRAAW